MGSRGGAVLGHSSSTSAPVLGPSDLQGQKSPQEQAGFLQEHHCFILAVFEGSKSRAVMNSSSRKFPFVDV